MISENIL